MPPIDLRLLACEQCAGCDHLLELHLDHGEDPDHPASTACTVLDCDCEMFEKPQW